MLRALVLAAFVATAYCGAKGPPQPPASPPAAAADGGSPGSAAADAGT